MKDNSLRFALMGAFSLVLSLVTVPLSARADDEGTLLTTFHTGSAGDPTWTMLTINEARSDDILRVDAHMDGTHCPMEWGFELLKGTPDNAKVFVGVTFQYLYGHGGSEVITTGPVSIWEQQVTNESQDACDHGLVIINFTLIPQGQFYFLEHRIGTPATSVATLKSHEGSAQIVASSRGFDQQFVDSEHFDMSQSRGAHVFAGSPGFWVSDKPTNPSDPQWQRNGGGAFASAEVGMGRSTRATFAHHPWFFFGTAGAMGGVSNATMTLPTGRVVDIVSETGVRIAGADVSAGDPAVYAHRTGSEYPPGEYAFDIQFNAGAARGASVWTLFGIDIQFPEEQEAA